MAGVFTGGISFNGLGLLHFGWTSLLSRLLLCYAKLGDACKE